MFTSSANSSTIALCRRPRCSMMAVFASTLIVSLRFGSIRTFSAMIGKDAFRLNNCAGANDLHRFDFVLGSALANRRHYDDRAGNRRARNLPMVHPPPDPAGGAVQPVPPKAPCARPGPAKPDSPPRLRGRPLGPRRLPPPFPPPHPPPP